MNNYFYEATDNGGETVVGKIDAATLMEAHKLLSERGYRPLSLVPNSTEPSSDSIEAPVVVRQTNTGPPISDVTIASNARVNSVSLPQRARVLQTLPPLTEADLRPVSVAGMSSAAILSSNVTGSQYRKASVVAPVSTDRTSASSADLLLFFQQLAPLVKSGMTIYSALENLAARTRCKPIADTARKMAETAHNGGRISDVMAMYPRIYPDHVVGTIRAGEIGGFLEIVLAEVALNYEQNIALFRGSKVWKMMVIQGWVTLALVIPLFSSIFNSTDMNANFHMYIQKEMIVLPIFLAVYLAIVGLSKYMQEPHMRRKRDAITLKIPAIGDLQRQSALSAFVRMLRKLYHAGVGPIQAWETAMNTADNIIIRERLIGAYSHMQLGGTLAEAFSATGLFADSIEQIVVTGQLSGEVVESLDQAANVYQARVQDAHDAARSMMFRTARIGALVLGGIALLWMCKTYFAGAFNLFG